MECPTCNAPLVFETLHLCPKCQHYYIGSSEDLETFDTESKGNHSFVLARNIIKWKIKIFIKEHVFQAFCDELKNHRSISLNLSKISADTCATLGQLIANSDAIEKLTIEGGGIDPDGWIALANGFKLNKSISKLRIQTERVPVLGGIENLLMTLDKIRPTTLHFKYQFNNNQLVTLFSSLKKNIDNYYMLRLEIINTGPDRFIPNLEVEAAFKDLIKTKNITQLTCDNVNFQNWSLLAEKFPKYSYIPYLSWSRSIFTAANAAAFGEVLKKAQCTIVDLVELEITDEGFISLFGNLQKSTSVQSIIIQQPISDQQFPAIADLWKNTKSLESCSFWPANSKKEKKTKLSNLDPLAEAIKTNKTIKTLKLGTSAEKVGAEFLRSLKHNTTLISIDFYIQISHSEYEVLYDSLKTHKSIRSISIRTPIIEYEDTPDPSLLLTWQLIRENKSLRRIVISLGSEIEIGGMIELSDSLKKNQTLTSCNITDLNHLRKKEIEPDCLYIVKEIFQVNKALREFKVNDNSLCEKECEENQNNQKSVYYNTMTILGNIARDPITRDRLPLEIWLLIFSHLDYPGLPSFESRVIEAFNKNYSLKKNKRVIDITNRHWIRKIFLVVLCLILVLCLVKLFLIVMGVRNNR